MSILLADIDATCSNLGYHDGSKYYIEDDTLQSLKHLIWILRRDNLDIHEYRRYIGHMKVVKTDLLPMLITYCNNFYLSDVLLRLLVNLTNPAILLFRSDLPKDNAGRRTYLDLVEISHTYKEAFATASDVWTALVKRLQKLLEIDVSDRMEEQNLIIERILVLTRNVLQVPANPQHEKRVDNDLSVHDQILLALSNSGLLGLLLHSILASRHENQFLLHALEIVHLLCRDQCVETLASATVERSASEKHADEQALIAARRLERAKLSQHLPPARHSRFGGTYVYRNVKSISERDLICHRPLERVFRASELSEDKAKVKPNHRAVRDEERYERQSAFRVRQMLREFCLSLLSGEIFDNLVRQVRRVLERASTGGSGHDESHLLWALRFFLEFNRRAGFRLEAVREALSTSTVHWICARIQHDADMVASDKRMKVSWNRRLQLGISAYREFLENLPMLEQIKDDSEAAALAMKLKSTVFYVVEYREIVIQLLLGYNENHFTRSYLRDLIDTASVYLKLMERYCQGKIVVETKVARKTKTKEMKEKKVVSEEEKTEKCLEKLEAEWDSKMASNLSVVLANEINLIEEEAPKAEEDTELSIAEQCKNNANNLLAFLHEEEFEKAVLLLRECRKLWPGEIFGFEGAQPEDELMTLKSLFVSTENSKEDADDFWKSFNGDENGEGAANSDEEDNNESYDEEEEEEEQETEMKEIVMNFNDIEKRLLNPKIIRACTFVLQSWERMSAREIKSAVTVLYRIAVNQKNPVMLMQAQLFQIFRQVLNSPSDDRYEELKRLATFVVKKFVKVAAKNPKIYAELLFFKSHRECYEIEYGYNEHYGGPESKSKWTEAQEEQLRSLYMLNQESPQTDQDVIDWIVENLHDKSRNRRSVIKKLKELGLIFKAPTKKSNAKSSNGGKNPFIKDEDDKLRELYDEHRLEENCLHMIMEVFNKKRSKRAIVKRMLQIGLIADESEILPVKLHKRHREESANASSSENSDSDSETDDDRPKPRHVSNFTFNAVASQRLKNEVAETLKEAIAWLIESLTEAVEDFEEASDDISDAIPLVPFTNAQREALENAQFVELLRSVNLIEPSGNEIYWKIPASMTPEDLMRRSKMLSGEAENEKESESEDEEGENDLFGRLRAQHQALAYNNSDTEEKKHEKEKVKKMNAKAAKKILRKMISEHEDELKSIREVLKTRMTDKSHGNLIEIENIEFMMSEACTKLMTTLSFETHSEGWKIPNGMKIGDLKKRLKVFEDALGAAAAADGDDDNNDDKEEEKLSDEDTKAQQRKNKKTRLRKTSESSSDDENRDKNDSDIENYTENQSKSRKRLLSDLEESTSVSENDSQTQNSTNSQNNTRKIRSASENSNTSTSSSTKKPRKALETSKRQIESDSEDDSMIIKKRKRTKDSDELTMNTQQLKQQLAELGESSEDEEDVRKSVKRKALESSDDENEMNANNSSVKMPRKALRIVDSDDE